MEKINVEEIKFEYLGGKIGNEICNIQKTFFNKINEIIDVLNKKEEWKNDNCGSITAKKMGYLMDVEEKKQLVGTNWNVAALDNDWEKEFDKEYDDLWGTSIYGYAIRDGIKQFIRNLIK